MTRPEYNDDDARRNLLDDYVALADEWSARIDQLQAENETLRGTVSRLQSSVDYYERNLKAAEEGDDLKQLADTQARIISQKNDEIARLAADRNHIMRTLERLTPMGSEYANDPERCAEYVNDSKRRTVQYAKEANDLRAEVQRLTAEVARLQSCDRRNEEDALYVPALVEQGE